MIVRQRRPWIILGTGIAIGCASIVFYLQTREPSYQGKSLSEWLEDLDHQKARLGKGRHPAFDDALEAMLTAQGSRFLDDSFRTSVNQSTNAAWSVAQNNMSVSGQRTFTWSVASGGPVVAQGKWVTVPYVQKQAPPMAPASGRPAIALDHLEDVKSSHEKRIQAEEAIRQMGERAVPFTIKRIRAKEPWLKQKLRALAQKQSLVGFHFRNLARDRWRAEQAIQCLGKSAVPALITLLEDKDPHTRRLAVRILESLGDQAEQALPALDNLANDPDFRVSVSAECAAASIRGGLKIPPPRSSRGNEAQISSGNLK